MLYIGIQTRSMTSRPKNNTPKPKPATVFTCLIFSPDLPVLKTVGDLPVFRDAQNGLL